MPSKIQTLPFSIKLIWRCCIEVMYCGVYAQHSMKQPAPFFLFKQKYCHIPYILVKCQDGMKNRYPPSLMITTCHFPTDPSTVSMSVQVASAASVTLQNSWDMLVNCSNDSRSPQVCLDCQRNVFSLHTAVEHKRAVVFLGSSTASDRRQQQI